MGSDRFDPFTHDISNVAKEMTSMRGPACSAYAGDIIEMVAAKRAPDIPIRWEMALKSCEQTASMLDTLIVRLEPVMRRDREFPNANDDETADIDPSSKVSRVLRQIVEMQTALQNRIEQTLNSLEL